MWMKSLVFIVGYSIYRLTDGLEYGLLFGLIVGVRDRKRLLDDDIQTAETISWSQVRARKVAKWVVWRGLLVGALSGIISFFGFLLYTFYLAVTPVEQGGYGASGDFMRGVIGPLVVSTLGSLYVFVVVAFILSFFFRLAWRASRWVEYQPHHRGKRDNQSWDEEFS